MVLIITDDTSIKGSNTVVGIIRSSLLWFIAGRPEIRVVHVRADNAACYHSQTTIQALYSLRNEFKERGLEIGGIHFNEPGNYQSKSLMYFQDFSNTDFNVT